MKKLFLLLVLPFCISLALPGSIDAGRRPPQNSLPGGQGASLPQDLAVRYGDALRSSAAVDTFVLLDENFDSGGGNKPAGWTTHDLNAQIATFFHVADGTELGGGTFGNLLPLNGSKSMWCGVAPTTAAPFCGYATLPGYGNDWDQRLESVLVAGDSVAITYTVFWDSEPGYDGTVVEYTFDNGTTWHLFPVTDTLTARASTYDGTGIAGGITESFTNQIAGTPGGNVKVRFRFQSSGAWSDEDGLWPTDGAIMVDDITLQTYAGGGLVTNNTETFEAATTGSNTAGIWTGTTGSGFGDFAALYPGVSLTQEDPCQFVPLFVWGFFDDPLITSYDCHTPDPLPVQGAVPFGPSTEGLYLSNEVWTPAVPNTGSGVEYRLRFLVYKDLPIDNLQFFTWRVRAWASGCPGDWRDGGFVYYGGHRNWLRPTYDIGALVDASADSVQVAVGLIDMCPFWCNASRIGYGSGACHSHAPLFDVIRLERIANFGPQWIVRHLDLFQDNFSANGTVTGTARADAAFDILPVSNPGIIPGDSVAMTIAPVTTVSGGPTAWLYARVNNSNSPKSGAGLGSPNTRAGKSGNRWPYVTNWTDANSKVWEIFQMDSAFTAAGGAVADRYCVDLNDVLFVPGDTILYFFGADADATPNNGSETYWHRKLDGQGDDHVTADREEAAASPCEFTVLPAGGVNRGGDILYVDDTDDRGGPAELHFDSSFDHLGIRDLVDRYDVLAPSSFAANSLASRVTNNFNQITNIYRKIIWNTGNLEAGLIGDGTGEPEKADDYMLLEQFIRTSTKGPGLYISGDDVAEEWVTLGGAGAILLKISWIPFNLLDGDHVNFGEPISPTFTATGTSFIHLGTPDKLAAFGGCPIIDDFDVLQPTGVSAEDFPYPNAGTGNGAAVISSQQLNAQSQTATIVLSGFSFHHIRDVTSGFPPARTEHLRDILIYLGNTVSEPTGIPTDGPQLATYLDHNYPNPFNPTTTIRYGVKTQAHVSLKVYNVAGQLVKTLVNGIQQPTAEYKVKWNGDSDSGQAVASGVYFYKLVTKDFAQTRKMVLLK
jgi:hypothetical protein